MTGRLATVMKQGVKEVEEQATDVSVTTNGTPGNSEGGDKSLYSNKFCFDNTVNTLSVSQTVWFHLFGNICMCICE